MANNTSTAVAPKSEPVGGRIRRVRKSKRVRQKELARMIGISPGALTNFEKGRRRISIDWLHVIAEALDTPVAFFLDEGLSSNSIPAGDPRERRLIDAWRRLEKHPELQKDFLKLIEDLGHPSWSCSYSTPAAAMTHEGFGGEVVAARVLA